MAFTIAFNVSKEDCECGCHYCGDDIYATKEHCILKRIFNAVRRY